MLTECPRCGSLEIFTPGSCNCRRHEVAILEQDVQRRYDRQARAWTDEIESIDWRTVYAKDPGDAAQDAVQRDDQDACEGITNTAHVLVRWTDEKLAEQIDLFVVYGELVPEYHASVDRFEFREAKTADAVLQHIGAGFLPDDRRPQSYLGKDYYSPERIRERQERRDANR